ncbi:MAG: ribonuclease III [Bacteroidales bacterium]|nr:ribonuclease III [Bacteroidales bacterium]
MVSLFLKKRNGTYILDKKEFSSRLQRILGFKARNLVIYEMAFIHRSASYTLPDGTRINNERLEYLGDAVLDIILAEYLFGKFPNADEGTLTKIRSRLVNREILNQAAFKMGIDTLLVTHVVNNRVSRHLYGDALEALTGAIFIDKGYRKTRKFVIGKLMKTYIDLEKVIETDSDYKSLLFEWAQKEKKPVIFSFSEEYDFDQKQSLFSATLTIENKIMGKGSGTSKKEAEQEASQQAWEILSTEKLPSDGKR